MIILIRFRDVLTNTVLVSHEVYHLTVIEQKKNFIPSELLVSYDSENNVAQYTFVENYLCFGGTYFFHHQSVGQFLLDYTMQHFRKQLPSDPIFRAVNIMQFYTIIN